VKTIGNYWPYSTTVYDYVHRAMPFNAPGSLTPNETYALVAWLLAENEVIPRDAVMNAQTLPKVQMPARSHFVLDDRRGGQPFR
jgi:cytochrome c